jgi:hypothetical protein
MDPRNNAGKRSNSLSFYPYSIKYKKEIFYPNLLPFSHFILVRTIRSNLDLSDQSHIIHPGKRECRSLKVANYGVLVQLHEEGS